MEKKRALLVVAGGRAAPDVLSLLYLQPQLVIVITSEEGWQAEEAFRGIAKALGSCQVEIIPKINAYNLEIGKEACRQAYGRAYTLDPHADWSWTFTIGSSPKI